MTKRVTIQDIADALGLSRNTVSKAINNTGIISEATRNQVLQKASELGYKQFSYLDISSLTANEETARSSQSKEIALLTAGRLGGSHFSTTMLDKIQRELARFDYGFTIFRVMPEELKALSLPGSLDLSRIAAIVCIELFDPAYSLMVCELGIPVLFIDSPVMYGGKSLNADVLLMDNQTAIYEFIRLLKERSVTEIGFVGEKLHCRSFFERYSAYRSALDYFGLEYHEPYCISGNAEDRTDKNYLEYLDESLREMPSLPEVFLFANDFVAIDTMRVLREMNVRVPEDLKLFGFDDSPESRIVSPPLSTIHIHSEIMAYTAVSLLISRIKDPTLNYRTVHTEAGIRLRESTGDVYEQAV